MFETDEGTKNTVEKLLTFRAAAEQLGLPYYKIQRSAKAALFPTYRFFNSRPLVRLTEVVAAVEASKQTAAQ